MGIQVCLIVSRQISPQGQTMRVCSSEELQKKKNSSAQDCVDLS